jgi:hypothetical protein
MTLPNSVASIGKHAFRLAFYLTSINIPDNVTRIEDNTFYGCMNLSSINIPDGVTSIGNNAFNGCSALKSIKIPSGVTYIGKSAFIESGLYSVTIPENVKFLRKYTFGFCYELKNVTIEKGYKELYDNCFYGCIGLSNVYCLADDVPHAEIKTFESCDLLHAKLHVPEGSIEKYKNTDPWSQFGSIIALTDEGTSIKSADRDDASEILRFTLDGKRINSPQKGLNIIRTRNGQTRKILVK